ncbi:hypothetical protein [Microbacterium sp. PMB16]|uniref:hypothetical protein n=1 Tax=Microbacterium sp. PMB16 TaxID=3120157 RepID=UPI003F4B2EEF
MNPGRRRRVAAAVFGISVLLGVGLLPPAQLTEAAWTDAERATATAGSVNVPEPISSTTPGCVASSAALGLNPKVTISWRVPSGATGYDLSVAEFGQVVTMGGPIVPITGTGLANVNTTGSSTAYVTVIDGALLSGLLGSSKTFGIRFTGPAGWKSDWLVSNPTMGLLGANPQCTTTTRASY